MMYILSHKVLDEVLQKHRIKSNDLTGIDKLFGGADGYYWYHTMRHMCPRGRRSCGAAKRRSARRCRATRTRPRRKTRSSRR